MQTLNENYKSYVIENNILEMEYPHVTTEQQSTPIPMEQPSKSITPVERLSISPTPPVGQASRLSIGLAWDCLKRQRVVYNKIQ